MRGPGIKIVSGYIKTKMEEIMNRRKKILYVDSCRQCRYKGFYGIYGFGCKHDENNIFRILDISIIPEECPLEDAADTYDPENWDASGQGVI